MSRRLPLMSLGGRLLRWALSKAVGPELVYPHHAGRAINAQIAFLQRCAADIPETGEARKTTLGLRPHSEGPARRERTDMLLASRTLPSFGALAVDEDLKARLEKR